MVCEEAFFLCLPSVLLVSGPEIPGYFKYVVHIRPLAVFQLQKSVQAIQRVGGNKGISRELNSTID